ncbi:S-adenosyl-L-methionine-dependent methyltransferase [Diplogelasinospora grovesii]|uniref:S-adenosyl-L-methionine-dependent methyltransferase n=1 Tax=Diplogelasinospora grovesii TaxID=303347 RepID=A0AAN6S4I8_9PEZI|nr:S-adenosyl-L-methionine-dependent methyltransferase [Diplogelasinospora grovesii]
MPRLNPSLFWRAHHISPHAARLLPACRTLPSALTELRWIREHVEVEQSYGSNIPPKIRLWQLCERRGKGIPLQYVLGTQPFGDLEIKCRPGVLIPRPETEAYTQHLAQILLNPPPTPNDSARPFSIVDFCTGTGCIPLQFLSQLSPDYPNLRITGVDISPHAVRLARENLRHNLSLLMLPPEIYSPHLPPPEASDRDVRASVQFTQGDIFSDSTIQNLQTQNPGGGGWDVLISNPPYISRDGFAKDTARSVRNYEPLSALVPPSQYKIDGVLDEDVFYARLLEVAEQLNPKRVLLEVASMEQAIRVVELLIRNDGLVERYKTVEVWRDDPRQHQNGQETVKVGNRAVVVRGSGQGRSVYLCQHDN